MRNILLGIIGVFALSGAWAEAACSTSPLLGFWHARNVSVEANNHVRRGCDEAALSLTCGDKNELELRWAYRCGSFEDWFYGGHEKFPLEAGDLLGRDGHLTEDEFYWDGLIPKVEYTTKIVLNLSENGKAAFEISENPSSYYPEDIFRGSFRRVAAPPSILNPKNHFPADKLNGDWTGQIRILGEKETICHIKNWNIRFERYVMFQTHLYLPECAEEVNFWLGSNFIRGDDVFAHPRDHGRFLEKRGAANAFGFERTWDGYVVRKEKVELGNDTLTYRIFTRDKEYRLELKRP